MADQAPFTEQQEARLREIIHEEIREDRTRRWDAALEDLRVNGLFPRRDASEA